MGNLFPVDKIIPKEGVLCGTPRAAVIRIPLEVFELGTLKVDTEIGIDSIRLPSFDPAVLAGKTVRFITWKIFPFQFLAPDGSVYIQHAHHPIDLSQIKFGAFSDGLLDAELQLRFCVSFEGLMGFDDFSHVLSCRLRHENEEPDDASE